MRQIVGIQLHYFWVWMYTSQADDFFFHRERRLNWIKKKFLINCYQLGCEMQGAKCSREKLLSHEETEHACSATFLIDALVQLLDSNVMVIG